MGRELPPREAVDQREIATRARRKRTDCDHVVPAQHDDGGLHGSYDVVAVEKSSRCVVHDAPGDHRRDRIEARVEDDDVGAVAGCD